MSLATKIPGMKPGAILRNLAVFTIYGFLTLILIMFLLVLAVILGGGGQGAGEASAESDVEGPAADNVEPNNAETDGGVETIDAGEDEVAENEAETEAGTAADVMEDEADDSQLSAENMEFVMEMTLAEQGLSTESVAHEGDTFAVSYYSNAQDEYELAGEIGYISGAYAGIVLEGHGGDRMVTTILEADGTSAGTFTVESSWAQAWATGEMSDDEFFGLIGDTIEY